MIWKDKIEGAAEGAEGIFLGVKAFLGVQKFMESDFNYVGDVSFILLEYWSV